MSNETNGIRVEKLRSRTCVSIVIYEQRPLALALAEYPLNYGWDRVEVDGRVAGFIAHVDRRIARHYWSARGETLHPDTRVAFDPDSMTEELYDVVTTYYQGPDDLN